MIVCFILHVLVFEGDVMLSFRNLLSLLGLGKFDKLKNILQFDSIYTIFVICY